MGAAEEEPYCLHIATNRKETLYICFTSTFKIIGTFSCKVSVGNHATDAEFCVILGKGEPLLGKDAAIMLGVLKIGIGMVSVKLGSQNSGEVLYSKVFGCVGKLKDRTVQLHTNPDVQPIARPAQRAGGEGRRED